MTSKKPLRDAFLFRDPAAAGALPVLPPTGRPFRASVAAGALPVLPPTGRPAKDFTAVAMQGAKRKSGAVRRCEPGEPITVVMPDPWYLGYAAALAEIWRLHHDGQMVRHILTAGGLTLKHLELGGVEERDLAAIRDACLGTRSEAQLHDRMGSSR